MVTRRLNEVVDVLVLQSIHRKFLVFFVEGVEHHLSHSLLVLIDMVHEHLQLSWYGFSGFHACRANGVIVSSSRLQTSLDVVNPCVDAFVGLVFFVEVVKCQPNKLSIHYRITVIEGVSIG